MVREDVDVAVAAAGLNPPRFGAAGYHLQQAAEKAVKALLVLAGEPFRHTHDLDYLMGSPRLSST
jgi:HEPN domain-containing protein